MKKGISVVAYVLIGAFVQGVIAAPMYSLYTDKRAMRVDDILTVYIVESAKAGSNSGTSTDKKNQVGVNGIQGTGLLSFIPAFGASGSVGVGFDGKGSTSREGSLLAKVTARVSKVLDNGNLVIDGNKMVEINNEKEIISVSGIVRAQDIQPDNFVYSYNISDAKITYSGKGAAHEGQRPGLIARFLNWIF